jgi:DNA-directed RNA polymerase subunit N (RpoN/RPB10)
MLIPVRCFTCGKLLGNKSEYYEAELLRRKLAMPESKTDINFDPLLIDINITDIKKTIAGEIMDELGLIRLCCRKSMLTHINVIDEI